LFRIKETEKKVEEKIILLESILDAWVQFWKNPQISYF